MNGIMRFPSRPVAGPRLGGSPTVVSTNGYPWVDGDVLYADDLNAAFLPIYGGQTITSDINSTGRILQGYAAGPLPTWANGPGNDGGIGWVELIAEAQFYTKTGGVAVGAMGRSSDYHRGTETPQVYAFVGYGASDVASGVGEAMYLEAASTVPFATALCIEMDIINAAGPAPTINPYQVLNTGATVGIAIASGGGPGRPGPLYPSSAALAIGSNRSNHTLGIIFGAASLKGTDGVTGTGTAIQMAKGHEIQWTWDNVGARSTFIRSDATAPSVGIEINNSGLHFVDAVTEATYIQINQFGATITGALGISAGLSVAGAAAFSGTVGFYGTSPVPKQTLTGAKGGNTALASVINALAVLGFVTDSTSA